MGLNDYNFKAVKSCAENEAVIVKNALKYSAMPLLYGGMPNLGFYTKPDGPGRQLGRIIACRKA